MEGFQEISWNENWGVLEKLFIYQQGKPKENTFTLIFNKDRRKETIRKKNIFFFITYNNFQY